MLEKYNDEYKCLNEGHLNKELVGETFAFVVWFRGEGVEFFEARVEKLIQVDSYACNPMDHFIIKAPEGSMCEEADGELHIDAYGDNWLVFDTVEEAKAGFIRWMKDEIKEAQRLLAEVE